MTYVTNVPDLSNTQLFLLKNLVMSEWQKPEIKSEREKNDAKETQQGRGICSVACHHKFGLFFQSQSETQDEAVVTMIMTAELRQRLEVSEILPPTHTYCQEKPDNSKIVKSVGALIHHYPPFVCSPATSSSGNCFRLTDRPASSSQDKLFPSTNFLADDSG